MATYVNDLRLKEIGTGDESGTWGVSTNTNLSLIADAFSLGTKQLAADTDETFTMPDATADGTRSLYLKITSAVPLTATRTVTLAPDTVSKVWIIENATTGSQIITIAQGSGATVNVPSGSKLMVVTDGAGAGAAVTLANPTVLLASGVSGQLPLANGGTGASLADPDADRILFWDDSAGEVAWLTAGTGLSISETTITATGTGGTVTSVGGTGTVNGITLTGTVTSSGNLTLGGTLSGVDLTTQVTGTLPVANGGTGITSFGTGVATALGQNVTGSGGIALATAPTLSGPTFNDGYTEEVFAATGTTPALSPTNGSIQTWTLSGNSTPTAGTWAAGQSLTLMVDDGTDYTITWTSLAVTWVGGSAPTLATSGFTVIELWKVSTTIYGALVGEVA